MKFRSFIVSRELGVVDRVRALTVNESREHGHYDDFDKALSDGSRRSGYSFGGSCR